MVAAKGWGKERIWGVIVKVPFTSQLMAVEAACPWVTHDHKGLSFRTLLVYAPLPRVECLPCLVLTWCCLARPQSPVPHLRSVGSSGLHLFGSRASLS